MMYWIEKILPKTIHNDYKGSPVALWLFIVLSLMSLIRSLIHMFAYDGGAGSIAGLDLTQGEANIIFAFGLWGGSQLIYAIIQLLVAFRYRTLIPLFYVILFFETVGRMVVGQMKPPVLLNGMPPGGIGNYILLPLSVMMLLLSLKSKKITKIDSYD